ncbi:AraC family transcriptional regulator [Polycladidibacter stylochi]|uniref:AraC family transcriptional regulator n=1 Tax=Polycladidibacter stylochi TaxID=1807766 RepID=UPI00082E077E|nr:helix-turn-helix transcriptional regulator [Pseudovibrio stylochi]
MDDVHPDVLVRPNHDAKVSVWAHAADIGEGVETQAHCHPDHGQLMHIYSGVMRVDTSSGSFVIPPERAVWVPAGVMHASAYPRAVKFRTLYLNTSFYEHLPQDCGVVQVTPLLRELIKVMMRRPQHYMRDSETGRLADVIADQICALPAATLSLQVSMAQGHRGLEEFCQQVREAPALAPSIDGAARGLAMSVRSFERHFKKATGQNYRVWCAQVKMLGALELLASGLRVSEISHQLGYEGASGFIQQFKSTFGTTPGQYYRNVLKGEKP